MEIPTIILMVILIRCPLIFENSVKEFMISQKNFNALLEEKLLKVDDLARNVDRLSLDVNSLKLGSSSPKHDINESLKLMRISIDECKERTARLLAKKESFIKACSSSLHENNDEDLKVIDVSPIRSMFCNMNFDDYGSDDESTLPRRRPKNSESLDLNDKFGKSEIGESSTSNNIEPTISDFKEFYYDNCSLKGCISLLQSVVNSPHA